MIQVRRYKDGDSYGINYRQENSWDATKNELEHVDNLARRGLAFTFFEDSARAEPFPIIVMGCNFLWSGCAQVWALPSHEARGHGLELVRGARYLLSNVASEHRLHRFQTLIHPMTPENIRWIKLLGFEAESVLRNADPLGQNVLMYRKLYPLGGPNGQAQRARNRLERDVEKLFTLDP